MKKIKLITIVTLIALNGFSQNVDSLNQVLDTAKTPLIKINVLRELSKYYRGNDPK